MTLAELTALFDAGHRRYHLVGSAQAGAVVGLDLEGRWFAVLNGDVLNRVNPEAFLGTCTRARYLNPGGDGLWASPEGSRLGYEYSTGAWRVPPGLSSARFWLTATTPHSASVRAEIDLINAQGLGVPTAFERHLHIAAAPNALTVQVTEVIEYLGALPHPRETLLLAPWTLCQFDCGAGCEARFPDTGAGCVWDLYGPSDERRTSRDGVWHVQTAGGPRFQLGIAPAVAYVEFADPRRGLTVLRTAAPLPAGQDFTDLADRPTQHEPDGPVARFSVYSDPTCFMEVEAAGGCPRLVTPGTRLELAVTTAFALNGGRPQ